MCFTVACPAFISRAFRAVNFYPTYINTRKIFQSHNTTAQHYEKKAFNFSHTCLPLLDVWR